ncbi:hypothetical protein [Microbacterium sp. A93]|uniref:hypothetical protein n=1 Tax=unclassified Microbacterium TaxID=2609290 RepID=UPI003F42D9FB
MDNGSFAFMLFGMPFVFAGLLILVLSVVVVAVCINFLAGAATKGLISLVRSRRVEDDRRALEHRASPDEPASDPARFE